MHRNLPPAPAFLNASLTDPSQEIALRVIAELPGWEFHVFGTATLIASHLAITARHVLAAIVDQFGATAAEQGFEIENYQVKLYQLLPGPVYRIWNVINAWDSETDIAILHLALDGTSSSDVPVEWKLPRLRLLPPPSGARVVAFGYRESKIDVHRGADGTHHIELNDMPTVSVGQVGTIFPERRDSSMLTFPCFEVCAQFAPGMSGGLVVDDAGALCGLVCSGISHVDPNAVPLSYAATLWPMLRTVISVDRGNSYPRGVSYPVIDLALDGFINTTGLEELDPRLFPGRSLPRR